MAMVIRHTVSWMLSTAAMVVHVHLRGKLLRQGQLHLHHCTMLVCTGLGLHTADLDTHLVCDRHIDCSEWCHA